MTLFWTQEHKLQFYNNYFIPIAASRHPAAFGAPCAVAWKDIFHVVSPFLDIVFNEKRAFKVKDQLLLAYRTKDKTAERYFTYSHSPIFTAKDEVGGTFCAVEETTEQVISHRRITKLHDISSCAPRFNLEQFYQYLATYFPKANKDITFACLYSSLGDKEPYQIQVRSEISEEYFPNSFCCNDKHPLNQLSSLWPDLKKCIKTGHSRTLIVSNLPPCQAWDIITQACKIIPFRVSNTVRFLLILGLSGHETLSNFDNENFYHLLGVQISSILGSIYTRQEEIKRIEMLSEIDKAKTSFFTNISHEFRTPLTLILGNVDQLLAKSELKSYQPYLLPLQRNALRLLKLVNILLDFSRIEAKRVEPKFELTDLALYTRDLASCFRSVCESAGLKLQVNCNLEQQVWIDREMWEKIVFNLLSNAFKYTLQGSISVFLDAQEHDVVLTIADTGVGIPQKEIPKLFQRFYRIENQKGRSYEGTGIGLSLMSELVRLLGGHFDVTSEENKGSTFRVFIPLGRAHISPNNIKQQSNSCIAKVEPKEISDYLIGVEEEHSSTKKESALVSEAFIPPSNDSLSTVLVVDDNQDMREFIGRVLEGHFKVLIANDGIEALQIIKNILPELIITDIMMPRMDGLQLIKEVKQNATTESIPIIVISARAGEEAKVDGLSTGAVDYIEKPFSAKELIVRVSNRIDNIREQKMKVQAKTELANQKQRENEFKDHFLAVLSHELRTPLTPVLLIAETLEFDDQIPPPVKEDIKLIGRNIKLEIQLIDDLLDIEKISQGKLILNKTVVVVEELLEDTLKILDFDIKEKKIVVKKQLQVGDSNVEADSARLQQVFWNIIKNAIKFTPEGGTLTLTSGSLLHTNQIRISIQDTGIGIDSEYLPKLFKSFEQGSRDITQQFGGLGLGLSISKTLVAMHGGTIEASSEGLNKGATFTVTLPKTTKSPSKAATFKIKSNIPPLSILLVEDNPATQMIMQRILQRLGHLVECADTCKDALVNISRRYHVPFQIFKSSVEKATFKMDQHWEEDYFQGFQSQWNADYFGGAQPFDFTNGYDLVLCDIGLPDGTGWDLIAAMRELFIRKTVTNFPVKIVALTGYGMANDINRSLEAGFDAHVTKPVPLAVLSDLLWNLFGRFKCSEYKANLASMSPK